MKRNRLIAIMLTVVMVLAMVPGFSLVASADTADVTFALTGQALDYTYNSDNNYYSLMNVEYCSNPQLSNGTTNYQFMNIYVPSAYLNEDGSINETAEVNGYTALTAPIIYSINGGGWQGNGPNGVSVDYINEGFVLACVAMRTRAQWADVGKAPATIVDLKAGVLFLKAYDDILPGNSEFLIATGSSGGGGIDTALAGSGDLEIYYSYLYEIGAAGMEFDGASYSSAYSDAIFGNQGYCPIIGLDTADMAYAWFRYPTTLTDAKTGSYSTSFTTFDVTLEGMLYEAYIDYVNNELNTGLALGADGRSGSFYEGVLAEISNSLNRYLDGVYGADASARIAFLNTQNTPGAGVAGFSNIDQWAVYDANGVVTVTDMDAYITYGNMTNRNKQVPGFDTKYSSGENNAYGVSGESHPHYSRKNAEVIAANWDELYAVATDAEKAEMVSWLTACLLEDEIKAVFGVSDVTTVPGFEAFVADDDYVRMIWDQGTMYNALTVSNLEEANVAQYWRIRHGTSDQHMAFNQSFSLYSILTNVHGVDVNYALTWGVGHGSNEGVGYGTFVEWVHEIVEEAGNVVVDKSVSASVLKQSGNTNTLTVTVVEELANGKFVTTKESFKIRNNADGVYVVGDYRVYVATQGNTKITACYFVS